MMAAGARGAVDLAAYSRACGMRIASTCTFLHFRDPELAEAKQQLRRTWSCPALPALGQRAPPTAEVRSERSDMSAPEPAVVPVKSACAEGAASTAMSSASERAAMRTMAAPTPTEEGFASSATMSKAETEMMSAMSMTKAIDMGEDAACLSPPPRTSPQLLPAAACYMGGGSPRACTQEARATWTGSDVQEERALTLLCEPSGASPEQHVVTISFPSVGSVVHGTGCKPCVYFNHGVCDMAAECKFCHFPDHTPGQKRARPPKGVRNKLKQAGCWRSFQ